MRESIVEDHAPITDLQLASFLSLSQITPAPLGFHLFFVGYTVKGVIGFALAWVALLQYQPLEICGIAARSRVSGAMISGGTI